MNGGTSATPPEERRGGPIAIMRDFPGFWIVFKYEVTWKEKPWEFKIGLANLRIFAISQKIINRLASKEPHMEAKSIPVMVDDRKDVGEFLMTRVAYFYVEAIEPSPDIPIDHRSLGIPVLPLEFSGVLHKPTDMGEHFETPEQIEELFRTVERHEWLYVDSDNIWIPNNLFNKKPERGDIYRVPFGSFIKLYSLCRDDATLDAGISRFKDKHNLIIFSEIETIAFAKWTNQIVKNVIAAYPKNEHLKLKWRE